MKRKKILIILIVVFVKANVFAQLYNGTDCSVTNGGVLSVINSSVVNGTTGDLKNAGTVYADQDIVNDGLIDGAGTTTGIFRLGENWVNNNTFNADTTIVDMFGNDQLISGSSITTFFDLRLNGFGVKLQTINAKTTYLDLTSNELATTDFIMEILSPDITAISRSSGFVSSANSGYLARHTNLASDYLFPTGSFLTGTVLYRPITIAPMDGALNVYGVRMAHASADDDGYSFSSKDARIKMFNENFYHHLYNNTSANGADITFHYQPGIDGEFANVAQWNPSGMWLSDFSEINSAGGGFSEIKIGGIYNFTSRAFILATKIDEIYIPNAFTPNGDDINDAFAISLNQEDFEEFTFIIFDRWGQIVKETNKSTFSWDGKFKNELLPTGVYPWRMVYRHSNDTEIRTKMGHVTLVK